MALLDAYDRTADACQLGDVDAALVESGRVIARRVDEAVETGEGQEVTKALYLIPHMMNVLREMGATPASRAGMKSAATKTAAPKTAPKDEIAERRSWRSA